ncbi:alpha/beta fold hydrolase [Blastococcus sp. MG754426]|uniref:alpha/beta hydrolase n=1 Tax=unclassified Blastococcus TaxID=2619396 RepID=UPI001EF01911|nr:MULTISPECIES: alpha/beta fold hydrolase [unclassified Blastococcus]MCF6506668.1 alpha/beta fold hydrolase [Blastococcus sp. MG754426]MCF6511480.1 alpha/beta fold hydrolase [Blastococcus sp. MG754427]MCF6734865.1 alpha/beta fold hydrolase [Blastococcus sp. KM273129]
MTSRRAAVLLIPLLTVGACTSSGEDDATAVDASPSATAGEVDMGACGFDVPAGVDVECGTLPVPADRDDPDAGEIQLAFAVVRSDSGSPAEDPVVYLSGGPGQSTLELVPQAFGQLYEPLTANRDLVLVDQRGTGLTEPSLACDEYSSWVRESLGSDLPPEELEAQAVGSLEECRQRLVDEGVDFSDYNSAASAADLEDLRVALGYDEWNLYGISYGTRLAQAALRDHPEGIRSVVLDAAYPVDADLYEETPGNAVRAMDALFATCADDAGCAARYPDLEPRFRALVDELNASPAPITVVDPANGQRIEDELDGDSLVGFLFQTLYSTELLAHLPEIIAAADDGQYGTIGLLLGALTQQLDLVSLGQQLAVQCQEEVPFGSREEAAEAAAEHPLVEGFFEGAPTLGPGVFDVCSSWDAGEPGPGADDPVTSDVPALVLAGILDPITPPRWGEEIAAGLSAGSFVEFPFTGHGALPSHDCAVRIATDFLDDPRSEPATDCVDDIAAPAFTADDVDVEMTSFEDEQLGLRGVRPDGWTKVVPGVWQESALVSLVQQVVPGATADQLLQQVGVQLSLAEPPQPVGELSTESSTWQLYRLDDLGQSVELALADGPDGLVLVQLTTSPDRADVHREQVFLPAVEALAPAP